MPDAPSHHRLNSSNDDERRTDGLKPSVVVVIVLAIILSCVLTLALMAPSKLYLAAIHAAPKVNATKVSLGEIKEALKTFEVDCERFPTSAEGLDVLVHAPSPCPDGWHPYTARVPHDAWGHAFIYVGPVPGGTDFDLYSIGEDGKDGTADDIHLRDLN